MKRILFVAIILCLPSHVASDVRFPTRRIPIESPVQETEYTEVTATEMASDQTYVLQSDKPTWLYFFPPGVLESEEFREEGAKYIQGRFVDDAEPTVKKWKSYSGRYVYPITPIKSGTVTVLAFEEGATERPLPVVLTVTGPRPPPDPDPEPDPEPEPQPVPTAETVRLSVVYDKANVSPSTAILLNALVGWNGLLDSGHEYRLYDIISTEPEALSSIAELAGVVPGLVVTDKVTGKAIHKGTLPNTFQDLKSIVGRLTGG
jgi:hypothetical protein